MYVTKIYIYVTQEISGQNTRTKSVIQIPHHNSIFLALGHISEALWCPRWYHNLLGFLVPFSSPCSSLPPRPKVYFEERLCLKYPMGNLHRLFLVEVKFWNLTLYLKYLWYVCPQYLSSFAQLAVTKSDWHLLFKIC